MTAGASGPQRNDHWPPPTRSVAPKGTIDWLPPLRILKGIVYRYRTGIPWRDLPREWFGPWQTVWKRHYLYARLGVWDRIHDELMAEADARGDIDWTVSVDATITRAHQHGTTTTRPDQPTGGQSESQETVRGRA